MNRTSTKFTIIFGALILLGTNAATFAGDLVLWYQQPVGKRHQRGVVSRQDPAPRPGRREGVVVRQRSAAHWQRTPGRADCRRHGAERIVLNEDSLWNGDENRSGNDKTMAPTIAWATCSSICRDMKTLRITGATSTSGTRWRTSATSRAA